MKNMFKNSSSISPVTNSTLIDLPTPSNISYMWNLGSLLALTLMIQIITGIMASMHYAANEMMAFESVVHISRDVNMGWLIKNAHSNGASLFFIFIYTHISRGLMFSSPQKKETWITGAVILLILMATAFLGYVLPWGQMSFWGATVITNLASAIPMVGIPLVEWLWGGFSVSNATLNRFLSLHFVMPFVLTALFIIHLTALHTKGSSNPQGMNSNMDKIPFHPFFPWKDFNLPILLMIIFMSVLNLHPQAMGDPENFNLANPMSTPIHIQPEWYFLFAYAILRSIPSKLGGVMALVASVIIIALHPFKSSGISSAKFNPIKKCMFWITATTFILLTWIGMKPVEAPYESIGKAVGIMYFCSITSI